MTTKTLTLLATLTMALLPRSGARAEALSCAEPVAPVADAGCGEKPVVAAARPARLDRGRLFHQIRYHLTLPASRPRILASLADTAELDAEETAWIASMLPRRTFTSGADVLATLFPDTPADVLARVDRVQVVASR